MANNLNLPIDYVTKDHEGFYQMMLDNIPLITPEWTNLNSSDPGVAILQNVAYGLHVLSYYENKATSESLLPTARTRRSIFDLANFLGYKPYDQTPAVVEVVFTKDDSQEGNTVSIPYRTVIGTDSSLGDQIIYETDVAVVIPADQTTVTVSATEGVSSYDEDLGIGDGTANQQFTLNYLSVMEDSIVLKTEEYGVVYRWTRVDSFIESGPSDRHFTVTNDEDGRKIVQVGNGSLGMRIALSAIVTADYRYGGGTRGQVGANKLVSVLDDRVAGSVTVNNPTASVGGSDQEPLDQIKVRAPKNRRTGDRAVSPTDFTDFAELEPEIVRAKLVESFSQEDNLFLYVATTDSLPAPQSLKDRIQGKIEDVMIMNQNLFIRDADYKPFDIITKVYLIEDAIRDEVEANILAKLRDVFSPANMTFESSIFKAYISSVIFQVPGVYNVIMGETMEDIICGETEIPRLQDIALDMTGGA